MGANDAEKIRDTFVTPMQEEEEGEEKGQEENEASFFGWPPTPDLLVPLLLVLVLLFLTILLAWLLHRRKKRSGKLDLLRRESFPPRRPIILAGELEEREAWLPPKRINPPPRAESSPLLAALPGKV